MHFCGKIVSTEIPDDTIVRASIECPECVKRQSTAYIWRIILDRYANESIAKSGQLYSLDTTADLIIDKFLQQKNRPIIEVVTTGVGLALSDMLTAMGLHHKKVHSVISRAGNADIHKYKE